MKVVFDTNVYISEALFDALAEIVVRAGRDGAFCVYISEFILREIGRVLLRDFGVSRRFTSLTVKRAKKFAQLVETHQKVFEPLLDENDHPILETAVNANADFLVTGDKQLLALSPHRGIAILRVGGFHSILKNASLL